MCSITSVIVLSVCSDPSENWEVLEVIRTFSMSPFENEISLLCSLDTKVSSFIKDLKRAFAEPRINDDFYGCSAFIEYGIC